ncbi:MAG: PTS sugar transporter subunit IIA [Chthoniobacteraceae bacterium]
MLSITDTLRPERIRLALAATDGDAAIRETAALLRSSPSVLEWEPMLAGLLRAAPCIGERDGDFAFCLPHVRTDAVNAMVMSIGRSPAGIIFADSPQPVRYVFCIALPKALDSDYLRILGLLSRILKAPESEAMLRDAPSPEKLIDRLAQLEARL